MVLDSSGTCDGERRMAVANALPSARFEVRDRSPMEVTDDGLGHVLRLLLRCCRPSGRNVCVRAIRSQFDLHVGKSSCQRIASCNV
jgi:hypothetical protein